MNKHLNKLSTLVLGTAIAATTSYANGALEKVHKDYSLEQNIYESDIANGRKVIVIEYHDDYDRQAGAIFEELMKTLQIDHC